MEHGGEAYFFSLNFNLAGQSLPPIQPGTVVAQHPRLSWLIIAFDALVMNEDRHPQNIAHDTPSNRVQIFDHSHALLGSGNDIDGRLSQAKGKLSIGGHCLAKEIATEDGKKLACDRIASLPDYLIEGLVDHACSLGIPTAKKPLFVDYVKERRNNLEALLDQNKASFPKLPKGGP